MNRIDQKVAIVTGGTQGLGAAIAWQFALSGAKAVFTSGRNVEKGQSVAKNIQDQTGVPVYFIEADLADITTCRKLIARR